MARQAASRKGGQSAAARTPAAAVARPSALLDTRIIPARRDCGDCLDQLRKLPDGCIDLIYIDPPFNSNRSTSSRISGTVTEDVTDKMR